MTSRTTLSVSAVLALLAVASGAFALGPYMNYQGRILDADGQPAKDGNYLLTFALFDKGKEGTQTWAEQQYVTTLDGAYGVLLGSVTPIELKDTGKPVFLAIAKKDEDITKVERAQIVFLVPDAIDTEHIRDGAVTAPKLADGIGMKFVYNDFADSTTTETGQEVTLKRYTMPANTLKKGMLITVTGESYSDGAALTLYVNGRAIKSTSYETQAEGLIRVGLGTINARVTGVAWDKPVLVEVHGTITTSFGAMRAGQEVTCSSLTIMGD